MSVPDHELDEPDPLLCAEHGQAQPCKECRWERQLDEYERKRKGE